MSIINLLTQAINEDKPHRDLTTMLLFEDRDLMMRAKIVAKAPGVFYGKNFVTTLYEQILQGATLESVVADGTVLSPGMTVVSAVAPIQALLETERVLLNFLQHFSGVATMTRQFVDRLNDPVIQILDTRKTTPGLRDFEKKAVVAGGGVNHRFGLSDMVLIKENHLNIFLQEHGLDEFQTRLRQFRSQNPDKKIELEVESVDQLRSLPILLVDYVMFDNFKRDEIIEGAEVCKTLGFKGEIEVSGNVNLDTISQYTGLPIHRISVGSLTHSFKALDLSMLMEPIHD